MCCFVLALTCPPRPQPPWNVLKMPSKIRVSKLVPTQVNVSATRQTQMENFATSVGTQYSSTKQSETIVGFKSAARAGMVEVEAR